MVYEFSKSRTRDAPLALLKDCSGYPQADLLKTPRGRPHEALAAYKELVGIERQIKDVSDEERLRARREPTVPLLTQFKAWLDNAVHSVVPKDCLGEAIHYALTHCDSPHSIYRGGILWAHRAMLPSAA
ncbi:MAG: IS66 family transposase [Steroidobacteraceae bacterium]